MKKIICLLLCMLVLSGCSSENKGELKEKEETRIEESVDIEIPTFSIEVCGVQISEKEMESYELVSFDVKLVNSKGTEKEYSFQGYRITDVLNACGLSINEGEVVATATDGYETSYKENIILDTTLIAVLRNGEAFEEGPWLAPCSSKTNGDYLKNVSKIMIAVQ